MGWQVQYLLNKKLKENPELASEYASFPTFLSSQANTAIGLFYEVARMVDEASQPNEDVQQQSQVALSKLADYWNALELIDEQLENATEATEIESLAEQKAVLIEAAQAFLLDLENVNSLYESDVNQGLQTALDMNETITVNLELETYRKTVNQIRLLSRIEQDGILSEEQIKALETIAQQCPEQYGTAVHEALSMLSDCDKKRIYICMPRIEEAPSPIITEVPGPDYIGSTTDKLVYPNPASSNFAVDIPGETGGKVEIIDLSGKRLWQQSFAQGGQQTVQKSLAPGVYVVSIKLPDGTVHTEKLTIQ